MEDLPRRPPKGYPRFAQVMNQAPELCIFRKFEGLNTYNLTVLQSELEVLHQELLHLQDVDRKAEQCEKTASFDTSVLSLKETRCCADDRRQWRMIGEIRSKLREYNEAFVHTERIVNYAPTNPIDAASQIEWLEAEDGGNKFMQGPEFFTYDETCQTDLVSMRHDRRDPDIITKAIDKSVPWFHYHIGYLWRDKKRQRDIEAGRPLPLYAPLQYYSSRTISRMVLSLLLLLACTLTTVPVVVLDYAPATSARMAILVSSTFLFSSALVVFTRATPPEVFAAAVAITAVQAVYLGGNCTCAVASA